MIQFRNSGVHMGLQLDNELPDVLCDGGPSTRLNPPERRFEIRCRRANLCGETFDPVLQNQLVKRYQRKGCLSDFSNTPCRAATSAISRSMVGGSGGLGMFRPAPSCRVA